MPVCHQSFNFMYVFALVSSLICLQLILVSASSESSEVTRPNLSDDAIANDWKIMDSNSESDEDSQMKIRSTSFLRFGREIPSGSFLRFGRSDPSFLRFGRNGGQFLRFGRRSQAAPTSHFLRFGRKTDFLRFG